MAKRYLANGLVLAVVHVAALDLLEVQIVRHFGQQKHVHKVAACHEEFGDQIHVVVAVLAKTVKFLLGRLAITEFLEQVLKLRQPAENHSQVQRCAIASIVVIAIQNQNLFLKKTRNPPTFFPSVARSPATMHSFNPVPRMTASYFPSARAGYSTPRILTGGTGCMIPSFLSNPIQ